MSPEVDLRFVNRRAQNMAWYALNESDQEKLAKASAADQDCMDIEEKTDPVDQQRIAQELEQLKAMASSLHEDGLEVTK